MNERYKKLNVSEMEKMYKKGACFSQIAKELGCSPSTVRDRLKGHVKLRETKAGRKKDSPPKLSRDKMIMIEYLYMTGNDSLQISIRSKVAKAIIDDYLENTRIGHLYDTRYASTYEKKPTTEQLLEQLKKEPCPFVDCSGRRNCKEINHPQECPVWKLYFDDANRNLEKETLKRLLK